MSDAKPELDAENKFDEYVFSIPKTGLYECIMVMKFLDGHTESHTWREEHAAAIERAKSHT